jgi:hypothetical protein
MVPRSGSAGNGRSMSRPSFIGILVLTVGLAVLAGLLL